MSEENNDLLIDNNDSNDNNGLLDNINDNIDNNNSIEVPLDVNKKKEEKKDLPEKFLNENGELDTEKLLQSYNELQKQFHNKDKEEDLLDIDTDKVDIDKVDTDEIFKDLKNKLESGEIDKISDDDIKKLKENGISDFIIDTFEKSVEKNKSKNLDESKKIQDEIYSIFDGSENYKQVMRWFSENNKEGYKLYSESVKNGNKEEILENVNSIFRRFKISGEKITGSVSKSNDSYQNISEFYKDLNSKRYKNDQTFEEYVTEKAKRSGFFNV